MKRLLLSAFVSLAAAGAARAQARVGSVYSPDRTPGAPIAAKIALHKGDIVTVLIAETQNVSRHAIDVEVSAGRHYKLVAEAGPGLRECTQVTLQTVDF